MKSFKLIALALVALLCMPAVAQNIKFKGVYNNGRDNDGELSSTYVGWNSTLSKSVFIVPQGIYAMQWDGETLSAPEKDPAVNVADFYAGGKFTDNDKALWATNFNLMYANSGAVMADGVITTVFSRTTESMEADGSNAFAVRKWDAITGELLSNKDYPRSANLESAGMCVNPVDGKVYGLFYLTAQSLPEEILNDPDFFTDTDGDATADDAGYCLCSIDLETMTVTPITPGLYYYNFVTFAINKEGRAFALTSGGTNGAIGEDGKMTDINGNLTGAQLFEFDLESGMMVTVPVQYTDPETGETYTEQVTPYPATGYCSQYKRQSACFSATNPNKLYWNGFFNSGKGINEYGSWGVLPDREWRTNGKYDTSLYEIDITTGEARRIANITNRYSFATMWIAEEDGAKPGDVSGDGSIDVDDINILINIMTGRDDASNYSGRAFVTGGSSVDVGDINAIINIMLGK